MVDGRAGSARVRPARVHNPITDRSMHDVEYFGGPLAGTLSEVGSPPNDSTRPLPRVVVEIEPATGVAGVRPRTGTYELTRWVRSTERWRYEWQGPRS